MVKSVTLLLAALCVSEVSLAQVASKQAATSRVRFMTFEEGEKTYALTEAQQVLREQLALKPTDSFVRVRTTTDQRGGVHERYAQYYQGIPVENGVYLVHSRQGRLTSINGEYEPIDQVDSKASVPEARALQLALHAAGVARASQTQPSSEQLRLLCLSPTALPKGELVIVSRLNPALAVTIPTLAWKFDINAEQPDSRALFYVDAHSGQVLGHVKQGADTTPSFSLAKPLGITAAVPATAETFWHGRRDLLTDAVPGGYVLRDVPSNGQWLIWTIGWDFQGNSGNAAHALPPPAFALPPNAYFYDYFNTGTYWAKGSLTEAGAIDIQWGTQMADEFYRKYYGRDGYDNNSSPVLNVVKYESPGLAQWKPPMPSAQSPVGTSCAMIRYGHGITGMGTINQTSLAAIDIIGHEYGHGIYWATLGTLTSQGEPGAICEGLSDIWGACLTAYIGEQNLMWNYGARTYPYYARPLDNPKSNNLPDT